MMELQKKLIYNDISIFAKMQIYLSMFCKSFEFQFKSLLEY